MQSERMPSYGGQALIEGVLMRGMHGLAAAFRQPDGNIVIKSETLPAIYQSRIRKLPFLRGLIILWDALGLGMKYLTVSANIQADENEKIEGPLLTFTLIFSLLIGITLFFILPALLGGWFQNLFNISSWLSNLLEGFVRLLIVVTYLVLIRKMDDIKRVFMYHGAEHKTINAFEAKSDLIPEKVQQFTTIHPRCGTGFLISLVLISIIFFSMLGPMPLITRLVTRILSIPLLAAFAYEWIRWSANRLTNPIVKILIWPNMFAQKLTTSEPTLDMLEVSIASFNAMYEQELSLAEMKKAKLSPVNVMD